MVLNADTWEKTHGFEDCINFDATVNDFKIINTLARHKGSLSIADLQKELKLEKDQLEPLLESTRQKHLVVQKDQQLQLHFQNPKILVPPETKMSSWLVTKPYSYGQNMPRKYSKSQIEKITLAAFGTDFTIRNNAEVFLPVYCIEVQNPDGSILTPTGMH